MSNNLKFYVKTEEELRLETHPDRTITIASDTGQIFLHNGVTVGGNPIGGSSGGAVDYVTPGKSWAHANLVSGLVDACRTPEGWFALTLGYGWDYGWTSSNGKDWVRRGALPTAPYNAIGVAYASAPDSRLVLIQRDRDKAFHSTDLGMTWNETTITSGEWRGIAVSQRTPTKLVAYGGANSTNPLAVSLDCGQTWTIPSYPEGVTGAYIVACLKRDNSSGPPPFVAVRNNPGGTAIPSVLIPVTGDCSQWVDAGHADPGGNPWGSIAASEDTFVIASTSGTPRLRYSKDRGETWQVPDVMPDIAGWNALLTWARGSFFLFKGSYNLNQPSTHHYYSSTDGVNWVRHLIPPTQRIGYVGSVISNDSQILCTGGYITPAA